MLQVYGDVKRKTTRIQTMLTRDIALWGRLGDEITFCNHRGFCLRIGNGQASPCISRLSCFNFWCIDRSVSYVIIVVTAAGTARTMFVPIPL